MTWSENFLWSLWNHIPMDNMNKTLAVHALVTLALCYLPGVSIILTWRKFSTISTWDSQILVLKYWFSNIDPQILILSYWLSSRCWLAGSKYTEEPNTLDFQGLSSSLLFIITILFINPCMVILFFITYWSTSWSPNCHFSCCRFLDSWLRMRKQLVSVSWKLSHIGPTSTKTHNAWNTRKLDKLLIEKSCSVSPTIMVT